MTTLFYKCTSNICSLHLLRSSSILSLFLCNFLGFLFSCMAAALSSYEVSDLCIGKPALRSLSVSATVGDALSALKDSDESCLSVWSCDHSAKIGSGFDDCECVGKVCMVDVVCYLCREENRADPASALESPVSEILAKVSGGVRHVEPHSSLLEAIDLIAEGAQNLVVPIKGSIHSNPRKKLLNNNSLCSTLHNGHVYCWITQEDVVRFLLNLIGLFSPIPALSIESLGIISTDILSLGYYDPASASVDTILKAVTQQTSIAVVGEYQNLIGEISPFTLACCDETVAAAITTLSAGDLMSYIDYGNPPDDVVRVVKARLRERKLDGLLELLEDFPMSSSSSVSSSSDDEFALSPPSPSSTARSNRYNRSNSYSARMTRRSEAIVCHPRSSLVAVMIQALTHRVNYVWVIEADYSLAGIVTFADMLKVFRNHLQSK